MTSTANSENDAQKLSLVDIASSIASPPQEQRIRSPFRAKFIGMPSCMSPQQVLQEQPLSSPAPATTTSKWNSFRPTDNDRDSSNQELSFSIDTSDIVKDQATRIASLQEELLHERSLIAQYRDEWDSVRNTLQAARRQNETLVKERDAYEKQASLLQQKVSDLEMTNTNLQKERDALAFVSRTATSSDHFISLPTLQSSLKEVVNKVGNYILERELQKGESGNIVTVYQKPDKDARFAMKVVNKSKACDWEMLRQLDREVGVLRKLKHANIIQLQDVLHGYRAFYLIFEHADMNLRDYQLQYAPHQSTSAWIKQAVIGICRALSHLHAGKIAHLDVRPENILLAGISRTVDGSIPLLEAKHVRLAGFGQCGNQKDLTSSLKGRMYSGSLGFFAPDLALSRSFVDGTACDMWSLGATLMDMTTGFCDGWMTSYECHAVDAAKFEKGLWSCLKNLKDKGLTWYKDGDLKDLLSNQLLVLPTMRATAEQVLQHKWLSMSKKSVIWV